MKNLLLNLLIFLFAGLVFSCTKIPVEKGFLSDEIKLKGGDTIDVQMGVRTRTDVAWLDGSSETVEFSIENVRDVNGNRSEQFFKPLPYRSWLKPYNDRTDTSLALVMAKLSEHEAPPLIINKTNGMLYFMETTGTLSKPGDVFHVDVKVKNSKGEKIVKDYAILRLSQTGRDFTIAMTTTALVLVNGGGGITFTLYDDVQMQFNPERVQNIYDRNGKELFDIHRTADTPYVGVRLLIQMKDSEGKIFPSQDYDKYSTQLSYFNLGVNRRNTPEGAWVEFPTTPWPVNDGFFTAFEKSGTYDFSLLDTATLHRAIYVERQYNGPLAGYDWPTVSWGPVAWFARLRSQLRFVRNGTYVMSVTFPFTHIDKTF